MPTSSCLFVNTLKGLRYIHEEFLAELWIRVRKWEKMPLIFMEWVSTKVVVMPMCFTAALQRIYFDVSRKIAKEKDIFLDAAGKCTWDHVSTAKKAPPVCILKGKSKSGEYRNYHFHWMDSSMDLAFGVSGTYMHEEVGVRMVLMSTCINWLANFLVGRRSSPSTLSTSSWEPKWVFSLYVMAAAARCGGSSPFLHLFR